jgi:hypothetical protein
MNEVKQQLIVPDRLIDNPKVAASTRVQMECPECHYTDETSVAGE